MLRDHGASLLPCFSVFLWDLRPTYPPAEWNSGNSIPAQLAYEAASLYLKARNLEDSNPACFRLYSMRLFNFPVLLLLSHVFITTSASAVPSSVNGSTEHVARQSTTVGTCISAPQKACGSLVALCISEVRSGQVRSFYCTVISFK